MLARNIGFQTGQCQGAGRLGNAAGVVENILDGGAHGIGVHQNDFIEQIAAQGKGFFAHQFHGGAVGKQPHVFEHQPFTSVDGLPHGTSVVGFHADDFDFRAHVFDKRGHAGGQATAADRQENGVDVFGVLADDFQADGALPGNYIGVVKRRDIG